MIQVQDCLRRRPLGGARRLQRFSRAFRECTAARFTGCRKIRARGSSGPTIGRRLCRTRRTLRRSGDRCRRAGLISVGVGRRRRSACPDRAGDDDPHSTGAPSHALVPLVWIKVLMGELRYICSQGSQLFRHYECGNGSPERSTVSKWPLRTRENYQRVHRRQGSPILTPAARAARPSPRAHPAVPAWCHGPVPRWQVRCRRRSRAMCDGRNLLPLIGGLP